MLIYCKLFGVGINKQIGVEIEPNDTVAKCESLLRIKAPNILAIKHMLYNGRLLDNKAKLSEYNLQKETTIQVNVSIKDDLDEKNEKKEEVENLSKSFHVDLSDKPVKAKSVMKGVVHNALRFGELIFVHVVEGKDLLDVDFIGKSDPYVLVVNNRQTYRTRIIDDNLSPFWDDIFVLYYNSESSESFDNLISFMAFDYDLLTADDSLGVLTIPISSIPLNIGQGSNMVDNWYQLEGVASGKIRIRLSRALISSPALRDIVIANQGKAWNKDIFHTHSLTIPKLLNDDAWFLWSGEDPEEDICNPAVEYLTNLLLNRSIYLTNNRTKSRIFHLLQTQKFVFTGDMVSNSLWITNIVDEKNVDLSANVWKPDEFFEAKNRIQILDHKLRMSKSLVNVVPEIRLLHQILSIAPRCRGITFHSPSPYPIAVATFDSVEDALLVFMKLQYNPYRIGFGNQFIKEPIRYCGFLKISTVVYPTWKIAWVVITEFFIHAYSDCHCSSLLTSVDLRKTFVLRTGQASFELVYSDEAEGETSSLFLRVFALIAYHQDTYSFQESADRWYAIICAARSGIPFPSKLFTEPNMAVFSEEEALQLSSNFPKESMQCEVCNRFFHINFFHLVAALQSKERFHFKCRFCLHKEMLAVFPFVTDKKSDDQIDPKSNPFSISDIQSILSKEEFTNYVEYKTSKMLSSMASFVKCPSCNVTMEVIKPKLANKNFKSMENSIRCRNCDKNFCIMCFVTPFHKDFSCDDYQIYLVSPHCRYCDSVVMPSVQPPSVPFPCCKKCMNLAETACVSKLSCEHICYGLLGETSHPPCLDEKCSSENSSIVTYEDDCGICLTELPSSPIVILNCSHAFHHSCLVKKITMKWQSKRIEFSCLLCPLCKAPISHPMMAADLAPLQSLKSMVEALSLSRLEFEHLEKDKQITSPDSPFYNNPLGFAMHHYVFYQCFTCHLPFFAGAYECQAADNEKIDPSELLCVNCQKVESVTRCPKHGLDWLAFKCRFCCSMATFHCWAKTHFCSNCHRSGTWEKLVNTRGVNKKKIDQYSQCSGLKKRVEGIMKDKKLRTEKQKEDALLKLISDPDTCPLKIRHPPNGFEFGIGCSMCADKNVNEEEKKDTPKVPIASAIGPGVPPSVGGKKGGDFICKYVGSDFDENGIIYYLGSDRRTRPWKNPAHIDLRIIKVFSTPIGSNSLPNTEFVGRSPGRCLTMQNPAAYFMIDFIDKQVQPTAYTLRHYSSWNIEALRHWIFEGSDNGIKFEMIKKHYDDRSLTRKNQSHTWAVFTWKKYRYLRIRLTGKNSNNHNYLACAGFEVYGTLSPL